jgi:hypothetical protein
MLYLNRLTDILSSQFGWHGNRLVFMARFVIAAPQVKTTNLWRFALPLKTGMTETYTHHHIRRSPSRSNFHFADLSALLMRLLSKDPLCATVLDRTECHFGSTPVNVLMIGIPHRGRAYNA